MSCGTHRIHGRSNIVDTVEGTMLWYVGFSISTVKVAILTIVLRDQLSPGLAALAITYIMMIGDSTRSSHALLSLTLPLACFFFDRIFQLDSEDDV